MAERMRALSGQAGSGLHAVTRVRHPVDSAGAQPACLIVNADDYGYYDCVSRGILQSARQGIVTATGILATGMRFDEQIAWLKEHPDLDLGLHLNLTDREPLTQDMRSRLTRWQGRFPPKFAVAMAVMSGTLPVADVREEWRAQIERCLDRGLIIRFLNSHEHIHMLPPLFRIVGELSREYGVAHVRLPTAGWFRNWKPGALIRDTLMKGLAAINRNHLDYPAPVFLGMAESGRLSLAALRKLIPRMQAGGVYELMCHPGFRVDAEIDNPQLFGYHDWEGELAALTSAEARVLLDRHGIRLIGYRDLEHRDGQRVAPSPVN
jgi:chitin disaccharide deacetylase